jgi:small subunit ribosomal protein S1
MTNILDRLATEVDKLKASKSTKDTAESVKIKANLAENEAEIASAMGQLLATQDLKFPKVSDVVEGTIIEIGSNAVYLDIETFGTGIVLGREIKDGMGSGKLKVGDKVSATIMDLENEDGYIELSVREASYEKAWEDIESKRDTQEKIITKVLSANKGGLLVEVNGISGFLPVSQLSSKNYPRVDDGDKNKILTLLKKLVSQELDVRILDADRESEKLIVSEKAAQSEKDQETISNLKVGDIVSGEISGVVDFGAFVKFSQPKTNKTEASATEDQLEGLVHISELAWQLIENPRDIAKVGDKVSAKIIGIDNDKISLSIRALQKDPWAAVTEKYNVGDIVSGTVNRINPFGAFVYLDKDIHGLAHVSEMTELFPGKSLNDVIKVGEKYDWKILSVEPKEHRMGLVLATKKAKNTKKDEETEGKEEIVKEKKEKVVKPKKTKVAKEEKIEE